MINHGNAGRMLVLLQNWNQVRHTTRWIMTVSMLCQANGSNWCFVAQQKRLLMQVSKFITFYYYQFLYSARINITY